MKKKNIEFVVGLFLIASILSFAWLSIKLGDIELFSKSTYSVSARFTSISGLKEGAVVELAGVRIGKVTHIALDREEYEAIIHMEIDSDIALQEDTMAAIRTAGVIGDKFVNITPGGADELITNNGEIEETESAISLEELVSKYIFESE
ncbi:MAG: outer membrane lipid asymmetry maintenance protein MlaD [Gammaproteobacteria bacterium]|nr:outer membrane lipid asymmetry maintenance protein MlaD [Gammaproteobacteria bacterium]